MRILVAFFITAVLLTAIVFANMATRSVIPGFLIVLATALWATIDSANLELKKYKGGIDHPLLVLIAVNCLWIVFFPMYLVIRSRRIDGELTLKKKYLVEEDAASRFDKSADRMDTPRAIDKPNEKELCYLCGKRLEAGELAARVCLACRV